MEAGVEADAIADATGHTCLQYPRPSYPLPWGRPRSGRDETSAATRMAQLSYTTLTDMT